MNYRILNLSETTIIPDDAPTYQLPVVPGAFEVDPQTPGLFTCKGKRIKAPKGAANGWTHEDYATVVHIAGGVYVVFSKFLDRIDPDNKGEDIKTYGKWPDEWRVVERTYDENGELIDEVITDTPTIRGIGGSGQTELIRKEPLKAEAIPL